MRDFSGLWQADLSKSVMRGPQPKEMRIRIEHRDPHLEQELIVTEADGTEQCLTFRYDTTGAETTNSIGGRSALSRARWEDSGLLIETSLGPLQFKDHWSLSDDGQTLTMTHRDDPLAGQDVVCRRV